jgi:hypothetical protein
MIIECLWAGALAISLTLMKIEDDRKGEKEKWEMMLWYKWQEEREESEARDRKRLQETERQFIEWLAEGL